MLIIYYNCVIYFSVGVFVIITILYREYVKNKNNLRILLCISLSFSPDIGRSRFASGIQSLDERERQRQYVRVCTYVQAREGARGKDEKSKWRWGGEPSLKNDRTDTADNHAVDIVADQSMSSETPEPSTLLGSKAYSQ